MRQLDTQPSAPMFANQAVVTSSTTAKLHLGYLDGLRALAALYVLLYHAWLIEFWEERRPSGLLTIFFGWMTYGHFAVGVFIVLSGFCLMLPVVRGDGTLREGAMRFFKRRARRILPPYYFALALSLLLATTMLSHKVGTLWDYSVPVTKTGVVAHLLLIHNVHHAMQINSPMWSVAVEWQIYFLFPLLVLGWSRLGGWRTTLAVILISYTAFFALYNTRLARLTCHYVALFSLGMLACVVSFSKEATWTKLRNGLPWREAAIALFSLLVLICCRWHEPELSKNIGFADFVVGLWTLCLLIFVSKDNLLHRLLSWKPLVFIGTFSYSIYLLHLPLLQICWQYGLQPLHLKNTITFLLLGTIGSMLVVGTSYLFFLFCERPFMNSSSHKLNNVLSHTTAQVARVEAK